MGRRRLALAATSAVLGVAGGWSLRFGGETVATRPLVLSRNGAVPHAERRKVLARQAHKMDAPDGQPWDLTVRVPVDPDQKGCRTVALKRAEVAALESVREQELRSTQGYGSAVVLIVPSWRQHAVQFDTLRASLGVLGLPAVVAGLTDSAWAYLLRHLQPGPLRQARKLMMAQLQVIYATEPLFNRLAQTFRDASLAFPGRQLVVVASDDAAWLVQAFLNSREEAYFAECPIRAVVLTGARSNGALGTLLSEIFPSKGAAATAAAAAAEETEAAAAEATLGDRDTGSRDIMVPSMSVREATPAAEVDSGSAAAAARGAESGAGRAVVGAKLQIPVYSFLGRGGGGIGSVDADAERASFTELGTGGATAVAAGWEAGAIVASEEAVATVAAAAPAGSLACLSLEDIEDCVLQSDDDSSASGNSGNSDLNWLGSAGLLGLWIRKVLQ